MSQHDFDILNQLFPATRTDLNAAFVALASNSSGDAEPAIKYANQWWYDTDTNTLKIRNEVNSNWISICTLDQSNNNVLSITTQGLTLGATALTSTGVDLNQLAALTRGSLIYGNASGETARLAKGTAGTVLTSDGTDLSFAALPASGTPAVLYPSDWASPTATYSSSGTWSKGSLDDDDYVWFFLLNGGGGGELQNGSHKYGGYAGNATLLYGKASTFNGGTYTIGAGSSGGTSGSASTIGNTTSFAFASALGIPTISVANIYQETEASKLLRMLNPQSSSAGTGAAYIKNSLVVPYIFDTGTLPAGKTRWFSNGHYAFSDTTGSVFAGGGGGGTYLTSHAGNGGTSTLSGTGGDGNSSGVGGNGTYPGGSGGSGTSGGGTGAAGNVRVYHV